MITTDFTDPDRVPEVALDWHRAGRGAVLILVTETWGSAPRRAGAMMAVSAEGGVTGSVAGGCVEGAVVVEALDALAEGRTRHVDYGVSDGDAMAAGLACGGRISLLVAPVGEGGLTATLLEDLVAARAARQAVALIFDEGGGFRLAHPGQRAALDDRFLADRSGIAQDGDTVIICNPAPRLVVVGAVQIAQSLLPMARACGYQPILIDPRGTFAAQARFPGEMIFEDYPDQVMRGPYLPDARTGVVVLAHDPKIDDPALRVALASNAFYIGCLGSTRTHAKRLERLAGAGDLTRLRGPVGLAIGAATPAEIALSILAQMTAKLRGAADLVPDPRT